MHRDPHLAQDPRLARLLDGGREDLVLREVLAPDVDEDVGGLDRMRGDEAALEQPVRYARHHLAVLEGARLGLVGIDDEVLRLGALAVDQRRLAPQWEAGAAAAAEVRLRELGDQVVRRHRAGLRDAAVAADCLVLRELRQVAFVGACEQDLVLVSHARPPRSRAPSRLGRAGGSGRRPRRRWRSRSRRDTRRHGA